MEEINKSLNNLQFQLSNVEGWLSVFNYKWAAIKAEYLIKAANELHAALLKQINK